MNAPNANNKCKTYYYSHFFLIRMRIISVQSVYVLYAPVIESVSGQNGQIYLIGVHSDSIIIRQVENTISMHGKKRVYKNEIT